MIPTPLSSVVGERFEIEREVGRGGVGIVYRAFDRVSRSWVALKVIAIPGVDAGEEARFYREGRVLAGLVHPSIVRLVAFGQLDEGQPYVAMEWLQGEDISQRQKRSPLSIGQCLEVAAQIADALSAAHAAGIIHRDVKPSNVILLGSGPGKNVPLVAKLVDFGVASAEDAKLTRTGAIVGTPAYMAPEQARGDSDISAAADLYGLGATLFEMIANRPPHVGPTPVAILARLVTTQAPRLSEVVAQVPVALDELMWQLLQTVPMDRPQDAEAVARELRKLASELVLHNERVERVVPDDTGTSTITTPPSSGISTPSFGGSRLVTSILATHVPKGAPRARLLSNLRARGADATELGGDAVVAHLGVRKALGDEAARALDLAMRLSRANSAVGVATGRTRIDRTRPMGEVVDRAAALARDAKRGQVLADTTTTELARGRFGFLLRPDGSALVGEPVPGKFEGVGGAPFVGREAELGQVLAAFERCVDDATPVVTTMTGAPGMGKTRLRQEALLRVSSHVSGPRVVLVRSETFSSTHALGIAAGIARGLAGVSNRVTQEEAATAVKELVGDHDGRDGRDLLARLMANDPLPALADARAARDALWMAFTQLGMSVARQRPLVIGIEDMQWVDGESLSLLDHLIGRSMGLPLWVFATTRPGLWRENPDLFVGREHVRVELRPLSKKSVRTIARALLGESVTDAEKTEKVIDTIVAQASGSPLFTEELARLHAKGQDATAAPTIEAAMQVHLDALDDAVRETAVKLSVFGFTGWETGLTALAVPHASDSLRALAAADIVREQAVSRFHGTGEWAFKHALMREVAYASIGEDLLKELHAHAASWLAKMGEDDAIVARHFELGGRSVEAAAYLEKAAARALAANALADAVSMAEKSLVFAEEKPVAFARAQILDEAWSRLDARAGERDTAVRAMEENVYDAASEIRTRGARLRYEDACGGGQDTSARLEQVRREACAAGLSDEEARSAAALAARYAYAGELDRAAEVADRLLVIAQEHAIPAAAVDAWQTFAVVAQARGEVGEALDARRSAARAASAAGLRTREATLTINVGFALTTVGARDEARAEIEAGISVAQAIGSPGTVRHGQMNLLGWTATFGADPKLNRLLEEPRSIAEGALTGSWVPHDRATLGVLYYRGLEFLRLDDATNAGLHARVRTDYAEHARTLLRIAAQGYQATKMLDVVPVALGFLAEAERRCGAHARAYELAKHASSLVEKGSPSLLNETPIFIALHRISSDLGRDDEAREAIVRGVPRLLTRMRALAKTPYAPSYLRELPTNVELLRVAEGFGLVPEEIRQVLATPYDTP
ncbi:serine/threonine-protein kinase PknK [Pendulispora albinea]|uniref:Protein kinase n=1 Tax=Pendulispora albinea TaxID=2741071 RepID=A0ABZ2M5F8_9BACT